MFAAQSAANNLQTSFSPPLEGRGRGWGEQLLKMNHIKTMLCGNFVGIDKLERLKLLQCDPQINEFAISIKEPETVSQFLGNFSYKQPKW